MKLSSKNSNTLAFFLFASPWLIGFICLTLIPMLASLVISFTNWDILSPPRWVGIKNYKDMFNDPLFFKALRVTLTYTLFSVPLNVVISIFLSILLNNKIAGMRIFRTIFYLPAVVSGVAASIVWLWMFNPDFGVFNNLLSIIGIKGPQWVYSEAWALPSLIFMSLWNIGGSIIIYLAALQGISTELYEAANMDGAGWWAKFFNIILPGISPMVLFTTMTGIITALQSFTSAFVMTKGGPNNATLFYAFYIYNNAFVWHKMGSASGQAWILFILIFIITYFLIRIMSKYVYYDAREGGDIL